MNYIIQSGDYVVEISSDSIEYHKKKDTDTPTFIFPPTKGITDSLKDFKSNLDNTKINIYQLLDNCSSEERLNIINYCIDKELNQRKIAQQQLNDLKNNLQLIRLYWYTENLIDNIMNNPQNIYLKTVILNKLIDDIFISMESLTLPGIEKVQDKINNIKDNMKKLIKIIQNKLSKQYSLNLNTYQIDTFDIEESLQNILINNETFNNLIKEIDDILNDRNEWDKIEDSKKILLEDKILVHANEFLPAKEPPVSESSIDESLLRKETSLKQENLLCNPIDNIDALFNIKNEPKIKVQEEVKEIKKINKKEKHKKEIINPLNSILDDGYKACTVEIDENGCLVPVNEELLNIRNLRATKIFNRREEFLTEDHLVNKALVLQTDEERIIHALYDIKIAKTISDLSYVPTQTLQAFPFIQKRYEKKYEKLLNDYLN